MLITAFRQFVTQISPGALKQGGVPQFGQASSGVWNKNYLTLIAIPEPT